MDKPTKPGQKDEGKHEFMFGATSAEEEARLKKGFKRKDVEAEKEKLSSNLNISWLSPTGDGLDAQGRSLRMLMLRKQEWERIKKISLVLFMIVLPIAALIYWQLKNEYEYDKRDLIAILGETPYGKGWRSSDPVAMDIYKRMEEAVFPIELKQLKTEANKLERNPLWVKELERRERMIRQQQLLRSRTSSISPYISESGILDMNSYLEDLKYGRKRSMPLPLDLDESTPP